MADQIAKVKKEIFKIEMKIDDLEEELRNCASTKEKRALQNQLKKVQEDPKYEELKKQLIELEGAKKQADAQAKATGADEVKSKITVNKKKDSLCAEAATPENVSALVVQSIEAGDKNLEPARLLKKVSELVGLDAIMEIDIISPLDAAMKGKDKQKILGALRCLKALAWAAPKVIGKMADLIQLFNDAKANKPAIEAAVAICRECCPEALPELVLPHVVAGVEEKKKWKIRAGSMELLAVVIERLEAPKELAEVLAKMIPICVEASRDVRSEIQDNAQGVLKAVGQQVKNPEIKSVNEPIIAALVNPTNQKLTQEALQKMGSLTFMNYVDANALALLTPILYRALREREQKSRKWASQIFGACVKLVKEVDFLEPYLPEMVPLLNDALIDPTPEVQREAAKAFAQLASAMPDTYEKLFRPFFHKLIRSNEENERCGAAAALSYIHHVFGKDTLPSFLEECYRGTEDENWRVRHSYLEILDILPALYKEEYASHIAATIPVVIRGSMDSDEFCKAAGIRGTSSMISYFAALCPELLFPAVRDRYFHETDEVQRLQAIQHLNLLANKIMDQKKYQQDLLSVEVGHAKVRSEIACLIFYVWKGDSDGACVRGVAQAWKNAGGSAKMLQGCLNAYRGLFKAINAGDRDDLKTGVTKVTESLLANSVTQEQLDEAAEDKYVSKLFVTLKTYGKLPQNGDQVEEKSIQRMRRSSTHGNLEQQKSEAKLAVKHCVEKLPAMNAEKQTYLEAIAFCILMEGQKRNQVLRHLHKAFDKFLPGAIPDNHFVSMVEEMFPHTEADDDDDGDELFRVDNMMLMYGGGHLLLKDTTLRLCRGRRYGVIGHNGAGKTTLMKLLASGGVANMPKDIVCVHVSDAELGNLKVLEMLPAEFIAKDAPEGVDPAKALAEVDFPEDMQGKLVSDLSGGWRMKLILARAMMKKADVILLDEPTNHLDVQAIAWLEDFLVKQNDASMMIISHEASFLNKVATDVMQYRDRKLHYFHGSWDAFHASLGLNDDDAAKLLKGDLNMDADAEEEDDDEKKAIVVQKQKLTFPIPGKLQGISSSSKAVMSCKNVWFAYNVDKGYVLKGVDAKLTMNSRVAIVGRNGAGKSTLMSLLCREINPIEGPEGAGDQEFFRHHNLRLAFIAQHHMETLGKWYMSTPYQYVQHRFQNGWDEELQKHLLQPKDEEESLKRAELGKIHGKYGLPIGAILGRTQKGKTLLYEIQWEGLTDSKQNTWEPLSKLKTMGMEKAAIACDERIQAQTSGNEQRQVTKREIVKHLEQFGIDEEMCCNREIGSFSAGQKSKLALAAAFWTRPHLVALDEPTNYLDPETVAALARALKWFRGGVVVITHNQGFIDEVCNETWHVADGQCEAKILDNDNARKG